MRQAFQDERRRTGDSAKPLGTRGRHGPCRRSQGGCHPSGSVSASPAARSEKGKRAARVYKGGDIALVSNRCCSNDHKFNTTKTAVAGTAGGLQLRGQRSKNQQGRVPSCSLSGEAAPPPAPASKGPDESLGSWPLLAPKLATAGSVFVTLV